MGNSLSERGADVDKGIIVPEESPASPTPPPFSPVIRDSDSLSPTTGTLDMPIGRETTDEDGKETAPPSSEHTSSSEDESGTSDEESIVVARIRAGKKIADAIVLSREQEKDLALSLVNDTSRYALQEFLSDSQYEAESEDTEHAAFRYQSTLALEGGELSEDTRSRVSRRAVSIWMEQGRTPRYKVKGKKRTPLESDGDEDPSSTKFTEPQPALISKGAYRICLSCFPY